MYSLDSGYLGDRQLFVRTSLHGGYFCTFAVARFALPISNCLKKNWKCLCRFGQVSPQHPVFVSRE